MFVSNNISWYLIKMHIALELKVSSEFNYELVVKGKSRFQFQNCKNVQFELLFTICLKRDRRKRCWVDKRIENQQF